MAEEPGAFDPADHTVAEVVDYVVAHPEEREAVLQAEYDGRDRSTLTSQLEAMA